MDWRCLNRFEEQRDGAFYLAALTYGQCLWMQGKAARALLCLDRAMGADLTGGEAELAAWPMPYAGMAWIIGATPEGVFIGNPRVHFQHYADRMNEPRREQRRWRAWACWALTRRISPGLPGDPRHEVTEPAEAEIFERLAGHGIPGEAQLWRAVLDTLSPR